jgi:predicted nucleic acid-binding protein
VVSSASQPQWLVVDAFVAAKWLLRDEDGRKEADNLLDLQSGSALTIVAPQQIDVEVSNSIRKAILERRLPADVGTQALRDWLGPLLAQFKLAPTARLLPQALIRSLQLGITLIDALYIVLAEELDAEFVTADSRLLRSPAGALPFMRPLSSYSNGRQSEGRNETQR